MGCCSSKKIFVEYDESESMEDLEYKVNRFYTTINKNNVHVAEIFIKEYLKQKNIYSKYNEGI